MSNSNVIILDESNFEDEVINSSVPVLVDFWAEWCGPCQMVLPIVDELSTDFKGKAKIGKVNVDENRTIAMKYRVMSIPTVLFFNNGEEVRREVGAKTKPDYTTIINSLL
ncbi:thioredoxin [Alkalibaculum sp. M08DMB]|uniref:Thioredoxin n=1 Tax=Alkalibaculum sporogenes TaxID=2655001 RepID=A0A6A7K7H4_9FIRM|nr:thioredoxin [Alkalibaculum sporogenes]MPW25346.1 thioredoxin [Alkalibaculum sporogenes]